MGLGEGRDVVYELVEAFNASAYGRKDWAERPKYRLVMTGREKDDAYLVYPRA